MSNIYTLKVVKNGITIQRKQIATGLRKGAIPLTLKADTDLTYVLQDESGLKPLAKIKTRFVGSDLYVVIDVQDEENTHLVLQGYADVQASSVLATPGKYGELVIFRTDATTALSGGDKALATWVAPGIDDGSALSFSSPLVWAGGGLLVAALASSRSSSSAETSTSATALGKINSYINASSIVSVPAPVLKDYTDAGITGVIDNAMAAAVNSVLKPLGTATVASAQSVVDAYLKVWNKANGTSVDTTTNDPSSADYQQLGLTTLPSGNGITLLNDIVKTRLTTDVDTLAKLNAFASIANRIILAAADNTVTLTAGEFNSLGLADITTANASVLLSAIVASANDGSGVSTVAQLKDISAAYLKILAHANGVRGDTTEVSKIPTIAEFKAVGATMGKAGDSSSAQSGAALKLLNDVMDGLATTAVDTVKEISDLAVVVDKLLNLSIAGSGTGAAVGLTVSDLVLLGVSGVTTDNLAQVVEAIRLTQSSNGTALDSVKKLQAAADLGVIMNYADTAPGTVAHIAPSLAQYQNVGLLNTDSGTNKAITLANKSAVDSAVEALSAADVSTTPKLQALVNAYGKVFTAANSIKADTLDAAKLTAVDVQTLGALSNYDAQTGAIGGITSGKALGSGIQQGAALRLFNDVIDGRSIGQVDTVLELNQLNVVIDKVLDLSNGFTPAVALTAAEFTLIGVTGVTSGTNGNLAKVTAGITATHNDTAHGSDGTLVDTLAELQAIASLAVVQSYSNDSAGALTIPNALTYSVDLGFTNISNNSNLANAVNSSLVVKDNGNISLSEVRQLVLDFQSILNEATSGTSNTNPNPSAAQYANVLSNTSHVFNVTSPNSPTALQGNALDLLNDVVRHKSQAGVDSVLELEAMATVVDKIINTAAGAAGNNVLFGELINILGMANTNQFSDFNNSAKTTALNNAIRNTVDSGEGVHTWDQLQFILNAAILG
jgi:hypothetical protein